MLPYELGDAAMLLIAMAIVLLLVAVDEGLLLLVCAWRRLGDDVSLLVDESDAKSVLGMS